ncbi:serine hydrolase [bacterium]|nr:serine hydrolase [bacterium]
MPKLAQKYDNRQYYADVYNTYPKISEVRTLRDYQNPQRSVRPVHLQANRKKIKRNNILHKIISIIFFTLIAFFVLPLGFQRVTMSFLHGSPYSEIKMDYHELLFPTTNYLANDLLFNQRYLTGAETKKPLMQSISETYRMGDLENSLKYVMSQYPSVKPAIYVWQYETEKFADINASEIYSAASIIKIPVLIELFRSIEKGQLSLEDKMTLTDYYRAEGSGGLQYKAENSEWSIDNLARIMITDSDNSATNMVMAKIGSMTDVNSAIRQWGLKNTYIQTWLPDMTGNNHTTARDMATMLYNVDNTDFLSLQSKEKIFDYMGHVHNSRLIKAGLGPGALFMHKTGDIGKMLGDAGIVFAPNGKKYIVVILANRPHNSPAGKEFIVKASEVIYNYMAK